MATKIKGENLMIFVKGADNVYKSIAFATNHTVSIQGSTSSEKTKDTGGFWESGDIQSLSWSISTENLNCGTNFDELFAIMASGATVDVVFGWKAEDQRSLDNLDHWTPGTKSQRGCFLYQGKASISNLQLNAPSGENSTLTADFSGVGELKQVTVDDGDHEADPDDATSGDTKS